MLRPLRAALIWLEPSSASQHDLNDLDDPALALGCEAGDALGQANTAEEGFARTLALRPRVGTAAPPCMRAAVTMCSAFAVRGPRSPVAPDAAWARHARTNSRRACCRWLQSLGRYEQTLRCSREQRCLGDQVADHELALGDGPCRRRLCPARRGELVGRCGATRTARRRAQRGARAFGIAAAETEAPAAGWIRAPQWAPAAPNLPGGRLGFDTASQGRHLAKRRNRCPILRARGAECADAGAQVSHFLAWSLGLNGVDVARPNPSNPDRASPAGRPSARPQDRFMKWAMDALRCGRTGAWAGAKASGVVCLPLRAGVSRPGGARRPVPAAPRHRARSCPAQATPHRPGGRRTRRSSRRTSRSSIAAAGRCRCPWSAR